MAQVGLRRPAFPAPRPNVLRGASRCRRPRGAFQQPDVAGRRLVEMWIDAGSHQRADFHVRTADVRQHVSHLPGGADDTQALVVGAKLFARPIAAGSKQRRGQQCYDHRARHGRIPAGFRSLAKRRSTTPPVVAGPLRLMKTDRPGRAPAPPVRIIEAASKLFNPKKIKV